MELFSGVFRADNNREAGYRVALIVVIAVVLAIFFAAQLLVDKAALKLFIKEGGLVETLSAVGYAVCIILMAIKGGAGYLRKYWYFVVVLLACCLRELDFDKRFTAEGIFKSKFLVSPDVSITAKVIGFAILLFLLFTLFTIVKKYAGRFIKALPTGTVFELSIVMAGMFLVISKTFDGLARKLRGFIEVSPEVNYMASNMEEALEFGVPCLFAIAIMVYFDRRQRGAS